ncbi:MAG TPA: choice-of-anchor D domain-containing protein [Acidobacteriaceae bacterium]|jgi:hypothetical protein|nr:choice-of-anchor D domain-containing protein [Acidobacteriaceae bacterium]
MKVSSSRQRLLTAALLTIVAIGLAALPASAQQVTYYNFNTPASPLNNPAQYSYTCSPAPASSNPLFCFNYATGSTVNPSFVPGPAVTSPWAVQMVHPAEGQDSSMWFSVPQKVAAGFNVWFQFKMTPSVNSDTTADGIAFVIQNAQGGGGNDVTGSCSETGSGPTVLGGGGGCMGYGGIDNSLALEFDTYDNGSGYGEPNGNHIALQDCGAGSVNSPDHNAGTCNVTLGTPTAPVSTLIATPSSSADGVTPINLADGNVHDVVIVYNGPLDPSPNTIAVYIDPTYNAGTHTPDSTSLLHPVFSGPFDITQAINLLNGDSAYVGFTAATGLYFQTTDIAGWTFTPHTTVTQQQPLNPPGSPTTYNFGTHSYTVQYPSDADTSGVGMGVIATTITPAQFTALLGLGPAQYAGSACQVYDDTGGNCIIYSAYCYNTAQPSQIEACPAGTQTTVCTDPTQTNAGCITLTSSYNSSGTPASPGYLQGDPFFSPVTSISEQGGSATITCTGECAASPGETITVLDASDNPLFTNVTVTTANPATPNTITISTPGGPTGTVTGGYLTSNNVQDIFTSYTPQSLDGTTVGRTQSFSDFSVTSTTLIGSQTSLAPPASPVIDNAAVEATATISAPLTGPTGLTLLSGQFVGNTFLPGNTLGGSVSFSDSNGAVTTCQNVSLTPVTNNNVTTYQAQCNYTPMNTGPDTLTATYSGDTYHQGSSDSQTFTVGPQTVQVTVATSPAGLTFDIGNASFTSTQMPTWNIGTQYTISVPTTTQTLSGMPNTQYVFSTWSNGVSSPTQTVNAPPTAAVYTADFTTQYKLSAAAGTGGTVAVTGGNNAYFTSGTPVSILATPSPGYTFSGWTGSADIASPSSASTTITMSGPESIAATFTAVSTLSVNPPRIDFGTLYLGDIVTQIVTVKNTGTASMTLSDPLIAILPGVNGNLSEFVTLNLCPKTLAAGKSCSMTVTFIAGPFYNPQSATLTVKTTTSGSVTVPFTATVINPQARLSASSLSFGTVKTNSSSAKSLTLTNAGTTPLSINNVALTGDTTDFSVSSNTCSSSLAVGKSCTIGVTFKPTAKTTDAANLVITDNAKNSPQTVTLSGKGD